MNRMITSGKRKVESRKVLLRTRVRYSRRVINQILLILYVLKLPGQGGALDQPDKDIVQGRQDLDKGGDAFAFLDKITKQVVRAVSFGDLYHQLSVLLSYDREGREPPDSCCIAHGD